MLAGQSTAQIWTSSSLTSNHHVVKMNYPDLERQPLLSALDVDTPSSPSLFQQLAGGLAALKAHKLPTTFQLDHLLSQLLASSLFCDAPTGNVLASGYGGRAAVLSQESEKVRCSLRDFLECLRTTLLARNAEDGMQEFINACWDSELDYSKLPVSRVRSRLR